MSFQRVPISKTDLAVTVMKSTSGRLQLCHSEAGDEDGK